MLTDAKVRTARPRPKPYKIGRCQQAAPARRPGGGKLWRWNYNYDGKNRTMAFGAYPLLSLVDARSRRDEAYTVLCEGHDPSIAKRFKIEANLEAGRQTFERIAREWHENATPQWAKVHASDVIRSLERDVFPSIGTLPIAQLTPPIILASCARSRHADRSRRPGASGSGFPRRSSMRSFGDRTADPAEQLGAVLKPLRRGRQPAITELMPLRKMILTAEEDHARPVTRLALRLLALTAVRPSQLRGARWDEFETSTARSPLWRIPAARMKGDLDRKDEAGGDHLVPLAPQAVLVLKALWPLSGGTDLLFPSNRHMHRAMSENAIGYLLNRAGYHGHHVPHGFRAAFSTIMNEWAERHGKEHDRKDHRPDARPRAERKGRGRLYPSCLHGSTTRACGRLSRHAERRTASAEPAHRSTGEASWTALAATVARCRGRGVPVSGQATARLILFQRARTDDVRCLELIKPACSAIIRNHRVRDFSPEILPFMRIVARRYGDRKYSVTDPLPAAETAMP